MTLGLFVLMNLFVAVLLSNFADLNDDDEEDEADKSGGTDGTDDGDDPARRATNRHARKKKKRPSEIAAEELARQLSGLHGDAAAAAAAATAAAAPRPLAVALSRLRDRCEWLTTRPPFDRAILALIFISCVCLCFDSPLLDPASPLARALAVADGMLIALFTAEMALKMAARGVLCGRAAAGDPVDLAARVKRGSLALSNRAPMGSPNSQPRQRPQLPRTDSQPSIWGGDGGAADAAADAPGGFKPSYLGDPWNLLDGAVVVVSLVTLALDHVGGGAAGGGGGLSALKVSRRDGSVSHVRIASAHHENVTAACDTVGLSALEALRALRALRPLRVIKVCQNDVSQKVA